MTNDEIKARIEELERQRFYLGMKDRWSSEDYSHDRKMWMEILDLQKKLDGDAN